MSPTFFLDLPTAAEIDRAPERAVIAAAQATLVLTVRVLEVLHPCPTTSFVPRPPVELLADSIRVCSTSLHSMLAAYDELLEREANGLDQDDPPF